MAECQRQMGSTAHHISAALCPSPSNTAIPLASTSSAAAIFVGRPQRAFHFPRFSLHFYAHLRRKPVPDGSSLARGTAVRSLSLTPYSCANHPHTDKFGKTPSQWTLPAGH